MNVTWQKRKFEINVVHNRMMNWKQNKIHRLKSKRYQSQTMSFGYFVWLFHSNLSIRSRVHAVKRKYFSFTKIIMWFRMGFRCQLSMEHFSLYFCSFFVSVGAKPLMLLRNSKVNFSFRCFYSVMFLLHFAGALFLHLSRNYYFT